MADSPNDPRRVDIPALAKSGEAWAQSLPMRAFGRVVAAAHPDAPPPADATVEVDASADSALHHGAQRLGLTLVAKAGLAMVCQRCLAPVEVPLDVDRRFVFADDEAAAAALDAEIDDDVLALEQPFDLLTLVEDELLLAMPLVPTHDVCPQPLLPPDTVGDEASADVDNPFAVLARLKRSQDGGAH